MTLNILTYVSIAIVNMYIMWRARNILLSPWFVADIYFQQTPVDSKIRTVNPTLYKIGTWNMYNGIINVITSTKSKADDAMNFLFSTI